MKEKMIFRVLSLGCNSFPNKTLPSTILALPPLPASPHSRFLRTTSIFPKAALKENYTLVLLDNFLTKNTGPLRTEFWVRSPSSEIHSGNIKLVKIYACVNFDRNSIHRMRSGHLNLKFMFPWCQLSGKKNRDAFSFILDKLKNCWRFLEMLVKKQQSRHVVLRGRLGETECICTTALDSALYQMLYLASLWAQKMNSFKTLTAIQVRCANVSKSLLTQLFPHKVPGRLARIFSSLCIYALTFIAISVHYVKR